jgi:glycine/D-amino acid oxidase-like deaminating enzyme
MPRQQFVQRYPIENSLWHASARQYIEQLPPEPGQHVDVGIIGAGVVGSACALRLQAGGASTLVLEAGEAGGGATGRSAGFVVPSFSAVSPLVLRESGGAEAEPLLRDIAGSARLLFDFIREHDIDCGAGQGGWFHPAHTHEILRRLQAEAAVWRELGGDVDILGSEETAAASGIAGYAGSLVARSGGTLQPVDLVRGSLRRAIERGSRVHTHCAATGIEHRNGRWHIEIEGGSVSCDRLLVCTNGRSAALGHGLEHCVVPLRICQIATEPLAEVQRKRLLQQGQSLADTRTNLFTYRFDRDGRLITGAMPVLPPGDGRSVARAMASRLASVLSLDTVPTVDYVWFGEASVTADRLPALYDLGPGAWGVSACNGRGLAASSMLAARMAEALLKGDTSRLPLVPTRPSPIPLRPLQKVGARLYSAYGRARDRLGL